MVIFTIQEKYLCSMELMFTLDTIDKAVNAVLPLLEKTKVIAFHGQMGAGKTTFIHALCIAIGVNDNISSPTYSIINQYTAAGGKTIWHLDLYRLSGEDEAINAGVEDCLYSGNTCLVEWPEKAAAIFPVDTLYVSISIAADNSRKISW